MLPQDNEGGTDPSITNIYSLVNTQAKLVPLLLALGSNALIILRNAVGAKLKS